MLRQDGDLGDGGGSGGSGGSGGLGGGVSPLPGIKELPGLVDRFQSAGTDVALSVDGDTGRLPGVVGLAVYRIMQEALTNVVKHAPSAPATARLSVSARAVTLAVTSLGPPANGAGTGHGVVSMRERAESLGGTCEAGPSGAGWQVRASFPLPGEVAS
jgi:signal transduction histidine kinase